MVVVGVEGPHPLSKGIPALVIPSHQISPRRVWAADGPSSDC